jgi:7-keto-8-aminopelargonate synthetase-like enzyme
MTWNGLGNFDGSKSRESAKQSAKPKVQMGKMLIVTESVFSMDGDSRFG